MKIWLEANRQKYIKSVRTQIRNLERKMVRSEYELKKLERLKEILKKFTND